VAVTRTDGTKVTGRITSSTDTQVTLTVDGEPVVVAFGDVKRAVVQVELNRAPDLELDDDIDDEE
jgi:ribosome maturation factor RimP